MEFMLKHRYHLDPVNGIDIYDDIIRLGRSSETQVFSINTFGLLTLKGVRKKVSDFEG
jgi:hypothetical protein